MPIVRKVLAQLNPSVTTLTTIYTAPYVNAAERQLLTGMDMTADSARRKAQGGTECDSIVVCNKSTATTFRVSVALGGAADNAKQYVYYDTPIGDNTTLTFSLPIPLLATDIVRVYAGSANMAFQLIGVEAQY